MGNCLKTQLKEVVNNDNLKEFDVLKIKITPIETFQVEQEQCLLYLSVTAEADLTVDNGGYFGMSLAARDPQNTSLHLTPDNEYTLFFANVASTIRIKSKYSVKEVATVRLVGYKKLYSFDLADFEYNPEMLYLTTFNENTKGSISSLKNLTSLINVGFPECPVYGDISNLSNLTELNFLDIHSTSITGDIKSLAKATNMTEIRFWNTSITGSIEEFAEGLIANGKTSGTIAFYTNGRVTYQGSGIGNCRITFSGDSYSVTLM